MHFRHMPRKRAVRIREGTHVVLVKWRPVKGGFRLWIEKKPKIAVEDESFEWATEAILEAAAVLTGDGEVTIDFDPPAPITSGPAPILQTYAVPRGPHSFLILNPEELFTGPQCPKCQYMTGKRSAAKMELWRSPGTDGGSAAPEMSMKGPGFTRMFYSSDFIARLSVAERKRFSWRDVVCPGRKKYCEIIGAKNPVSYIAIKGRKPFSVVRCKRCGQGPGPMYNGWVDSTPNHYISHADLPRGSDLGVIALGHPNEPELALTPERWKAFRGKPGGKRLRAAANIAVVPEVAVRRK
jgi:hypothetical protein